MAGIDPLSIGLSLGGKLIDHFFPDPTKNAEQKLELLKLAQNGDLAAMQGQIDVNKVEAANTNMFIAGWRPFVGWVCGMGLATQFLVRPIFVWASALFKHPTDFPPLDMGTLMVLLTGMLGFGGLRTYEKTQNAEGNR